MRYGRQGVLVFWSAFEGNRVGEAAETSQRLRLSQLFIQVCVWRVKNSGDETICVLKSRLIRKTTASHRYVSNDFNYHT